MYDSETKFIALNINNDDFFFYDFHSFVMVQKG